MKLVEDKELISEVITTNYRVISMKDLDFFDKETFGKLDIRDFEEYKKIVNDMLLLTKMRLEELQNMWGDPHVDNRKASSWVVQHNTCVGIVKVTKGIETELYIVLDRTDEEYLEFFHAYWDFMKSI